MAALTLNRHPLALLRRHRASGRFVTAETLFSYQDRQLARGAGIVTVRQRPSTANGVLFMTIEGETGSVNVIVWPSVLERYRKEVLAARLIGILGQWQCEGEVRHLVAQRLVDLTPLLGRDFC